MSEEASGASPKPKAGQVSKARALLGRARFNPKSARHVQNIAKAAAKGHPGAVVAQAAIAEARKSQAKAPPAPAALRAFSPSMAPAGRPSAFPAWARGAA